ncbi:MAG: Bacteriophytochrome cph2 [Pseudomonadota bacterium]|jgi:diguanylate cyclase (GGDEF)-like protein
MPYTQMTGRRYSLRRDLTSLVVVCVLPAIVVSAALSYSTYRAERDNVEQQTVLVANAIMAELARDLAVAESGLKILATSQELNSGDLRGFHARARDALVSGNVHNYILTDPQGRQLVNTLLPYGTALPTTGTPPELARVFRSKSTVLTDLFVGPVVRRPTIAMGVPVGAGDVVAYSLNMGMDPERVNAMIASQPLPDGWLVAVLDSSGTIVGRSREAKRFVGQKAVPELLAAVSVQDSGRMESVTKDGVPVFSAFVTSQPWKWTVVVGAPKAILEHGMRAKSLWVVSALLTAFGTGLWLARTISLRVISSVEHLSQAAMALGKGEEVSMPAIRMQEADHLGNAMLQAGQTMQKVKFDSQHDALTTLPNRLLFDEVAQRSIAYAQRRNQPLALLAIDLDGFKTVNDTLGHSAGDEVLRAVAQRIQETVRASDIAARIGGDEFVVLLTDVTSVTAMETAQRLVVLLSEPYPNVHLPVSASVGVALYPLHAINLTGLMHRADKALYEAKDQGRHRAVLAQQG